MNNGMKLSYVSVCDVYTLEERLALLERSKEALRAAEEQQKQIESKLKYAKTIEDKQILKTKLDKSKVRVKDLTCSLFLAQRDYDDKVKHMQETSEYIRYLMNRSR